MKKLKKIKIPKKSQIARKRVEQLKGIMTTSIKIKGRAKTRKKLGERS